MFSVSGGYIEDSVLSHCKMQVSQNKHYAFLTVKESQW